MKIKSAFTFVNLLTILCFFPSLYACSGDKSKDPNPNPGKTDVADTISGKVYDYTLTGKPERPYFHAYHTTLVMKFMMARPNLQTGGSNVLLNYEEAMKNIIAIDNISRGIPKIVYLVGWQFNGHDDKYPAFNVFNEALKRSGDATARDSYLWLKKEALKYNTTVSVHILLNDAYTNSPLWSTYVRNDLLCRNADGSFLTWGDPINNLPNYQVCLINEWKKGYTQKRLNELIELCDLTSSHTIHIDAFEPRESPWHGYSKSMTEEAMRKIIRFLRDKQIDVTSEFWHGNTRTDTFIGLQAMAWWNDLSNDERAAVSPELACGGISGQFDWNIWTDTGFLFGDNMHAEDLVNATTSYASVKKDFCLKTLMFVYFNTHKLLNYNATAKTTTYSDKVVADAIGRTVKQNGNFVRQGNDVFVPVMWRGGDYREIIAFSDGGYASKTWTLPTSWSSVTKVTIRRVTENGLSDARSEMLANGTLTLSMAANEMLSIIPE